MSARSEIVIPPKGMLIYLPLGSCGIIAQIDPEFCHHTSLEFVTEREWRHPMLCNAWICSDCWSIRDFDLGGAQ